MKIFFIFIFNTGSFQSIRFSNQSVFPPKMHKRSVASEVTVYFNFGFSGVNLESNSISQYALTDLLSHLRQSVTVRAFNEEIDSNNLENLAISELEIDEIVFVTQRDCKFHFKITFKVFHTSSTVTSSAFEDVDKITKKMFDKITKTSIMPEFECSLPLFCKTRFPRNVYTPAHLRCRCNPSSSLIYGPTFKSPTFMTMTFFFAMTNPFFSN